MTSDLSYPFAPGHHSGETDMAAAEAVKTIAPTLEKRCLELLVDGPRTPEELKALLEAERGRPVLLNSVRPRLSAAKAKGLVKDSGLRRPGEGGRCMAIAWALTSAEERALHAARRAAEMEKSGGGQ